MIKINDQFSVDSDSNQWTLIYQVEGEINPKTEKPKLTTNKWYCGSLEKCLMRYKDECSKGTESVDELLLKLDKINNSIKKVHELLDF